MSGHTVFLTDADEQFAPPASPLLEVGYVAPGNGQSALLFFDLVECDENAERTQYTALRVTTSDGKTPKAGISVDAVSFLHAIATVMDDHAIWTALVRTGATAQPKPATDGGA